MEKVSFNPQATAYPMPVALVGATVNDKPNFMAVAWFSKVNINPPMMMIAIGDQAYTGEGIKENMAFSVNIPGKDLVKETDYCGIKSGRTEDKSRLFKVFYGETGSAPMIEECSFNYELKLVETVELPGNNLFIGEIVAAYADTKSLSDQIPDISKTEPLILISPTRHYYDLGSQIADAFKIGNDLTQ